VEIENPPELEVEQFNFNVNSLCCDLRKDSTFCHNEGYSIVEVPLA
jgi:hypothetical protein